MKRSAKPDPESLTLADVRRRAMDLLARREHSAEELRHKLASRGMPSDLVDAALEGLAGEGLQSDARFAESCVSAWVRRGKGPNYIEQALRRAGVNGEARIAALDDADIDWQAQARLVRQKKFGEQSPEDWAERARQSRFLQRRGFTTEQIHAIFDA